MMEIYSELDRLLTAGERCVLARIIRQDGSAPRSVGTRFLIKGDGRNLGTIGGGILYYLNRLEKKLLEKRYERQAR